jgi:ubiquinone/menaquinone biosynthesis C-methylase UbiE
MTRQKFFEEAYRVLRPGGRMAMLDFLCDYDSLEADRAARLPRENYLPSLDAYRESLLAAGFKYVRVNDCTDMTIKAAADYMIRRMENEFGQSPDSEVLQDIAQTRRLAQSLFSGALVYAIK